MRRSRLSILGYPTKREEPPTPLQQQSAEAAATAPQPLSSVGTFLSHVVSPMWRKATQKLETPPPRVLLVDEERARRKSWASADGCITGLSREFGVGIFAVDCVLVILH